ncbi:AraC family transcriptional regulator ligand-binding domain-containing protein [Photobacterium ganghwense]|uniref:AraC family transcriptional regulator ligand-binding domain-containing protein n=1 Tax=Photobacterium ganghwense TaxID=320778 RepID=UPI00405786AD
MKNLYIRGANIARFDQFATQHQVNHHALLNAVGLSDDVFSHPEALISYHQFLRLIELSQRHFSCPLLGLEFGLFQSIAAIGPLFHLINNAQTVEQALSELISYFHWHSQGATLQLTEKENQMLLCYEPSIFLEQHDHAQCTEIAIGVGLKLLQLFFGHAWKPKAIYIRHYPLASVTEYQKLLPVTPHFNAFLTGIAFEKSALKTTLNHADPSLHALIENHVHALTNLTVEELPDYVRYVLHHLLPSGKSTVGQVAKYMMLSPRTLQRYLQAEGTSFQAILTETRQRLATRHLTESNMSMAQLAELLGYSDACAFSRAFVSWFGIAPRQWQQQNAERKSPRIHCRLPAMLNKQ